MHRGGRNLKVSLHVGLGRWAPVQFGVVVNEREELTLPPRVVTSHSEFPFEGFLEDGRGIASGLLKLREQKGSPTSNQTNSE